MGAQVFSTEEYEKQDRKRMDRETSGEVLAAENQLGQELTGKAVIDMRTGAKIGQVEEILFDINELRVATLMISQGGLLNRQSDPFPARNVQVWGKDVLLVNRADSPVAAQMTDNDRLIKLSDQLKGRYVVSTDGERVGQINDVLIDGQGRLAGYDLSQVFIKGRLADTKHIPVSATTSLGKDVLIVDLSRINPPEM